MLAEISELLELMIGESIKIFLQIGEWRCMYIIWKCVHIIYVISKPSASRSTSHVSLITHISDYL